jgi:hypothetical protein
MTITQKTFGKAFTQIYKFNDIANNFHNVDLDSIALQLDLIGEEYLETVDAFDKLDRVELLDGAIDCFVVVVGLLQKLQATGYNVSEALQRVNENNLSKFLPCDDSERTHREIIATKHTIDYNGKYNVIVLKNENNKIMKPKSFQPVELSDCVPVVI